MPAAGITTLDGKPIHAGGGIPYTDYLAIAQIIRLGNCRSAYIIGNGWGYSTLLIADLLGRMGKVDVIEACVRTDNQRLIEVTESIAAELDLDVRVTIGFSP